MIIIYILLYIKKCNMLNFERFEIIFINFEIILRINISYFIKIKMFMNILSGPYRDLLHLKF